MAASDFVTLKAGLTCPVAPILLLLNLEERGLQITRDGDDIVVQPYQSLTADDCHAIRRWKPHLLALLAYSAPEVH